MLGLVPAAIKFRGSQYDCLGGARSIGGVVCQATNCILTCGDLYRDLAPNDHSSFFHAKGYHEHVNWCQTLGGGVRTDAWGLI